MKKEPHAQQAIDLERITVHASCAMPNSVGRAAATAMAVFAFALTGPTSAQAERISMEPLRLTVQAGASGAITNTIELVNTDTNDTRTISLSVDLSGVSGVTGAVFADAVLVVPSAAPDPEDEDNDITNGTLSTTLTVSYNGSVPQTGVNEILIFATNTTAVSDWNFRLPLPFKSAVFWDGGTNAADVAFGTGVNWQGSAVPGAGDVAFFGTVVLGTNTVGTNEGIIAVPGLSMEVVEGTGTNAVTNIVALTNVIISADTPALAGLRFAQEDQPFYDEDDEEFQYEGVTYDVEIQTNVTVLVTGTEGFQMLGDDGGDQPVTLFGGGNLVISNSAAPFGLFSSGETLNMEGLATLVADVNRVCLDNFSCYPNRYTNGTFNPNGGYGAGADVYLAQSNYLKTAWIGGDAVVTNTGVAYFSRPYAFSLGVSGRTSGRNILFLGTTNVIYSESILLGGGGNNSSAGNVFFNTDTNFSPTNVVPVLYIRGEQETNRVAVLTVGDNSGQNQLNQHSKVTANLREGKVDAKIDKLYVGRDRWSCGDNDAITVEFQIGGTNGAGTIVDVNTAYVSMQELGTNHATAEELANDADPRGEVRGTLRVGSNAVFKINDTMHLGYTTAPAEDTSRKADNGYGSVYISDGGRVMVNTVLVGGETKLSGHHSVFNHREFNEQNAFILTGGGELVVTNQIGEDVVGGRLNGLIMSDSTLTVNLDGAKTNVYVYADEVVTGGLGNTIKLATIVNVGAFPTQLPLISYTSASPNFGVEMPSGFYGYIVNNTDSNTIDVVILDTPPANLVWGGTPGTTWDISAANWQGSLVFANGDTARFDDTATTPSIDLPGTVFIGGSGVLVTNSSLAYSISGAGTIGGTSPMNKWGTGSLAVNVASGLPLNLNEGTVTGSGAVGSTSVSSNGTFSFSGAVTRLISSGSATLLAGGSVANGADVNGGSLTNAGTINGVVELAGSNTLVEVTPSGTVTMSVPSTSEVGEGVTLDLDGTWNNGIVNGPGGTYRISVSGTMTGTGSIKTGSPDISHSSGERPSYWSRLVISSGGVLSPGSAPGILTVFTTESQVDFSPGSTIVLDVDMDSADGSNPKANAPTGSTGAKNSDVIFTSRWSTRTGTLRMNNVGVAPWAVGTVLKVFSKPFEEFGGGFRNRVFDGTTDQLPVMDPASPGAGMLWNLQEFSTNGVITIDGTASSPPVLGAVPFQGTNITFSWPTGYQGWELQSQANPLDVGLSTNWGVVTTVDSATNTSYTITNWISDELELRVYRMAHPEFE